MYCDYGNIYLNVICSLEVLEIKTIFLDTEKVGTTPKSIASLDRTASWLSSSTACLSGMTEPFLTSLCCPGVMPSPNIVMLYVSPPTIKIGTWLRIPRI